MSRFKLVSWNVAHLGRLMQPGAGSAIQTRRQAVVREIRELDADLICLIEGPGGEDAIDAFASELLDNDWVPMKSANGDYGIRGTQWIWFLVRKRHAERASLLPLATWRAFAGGRWYYNPWGSFDSIGHAHYRSPQVLVLERDGLRVEFVGLHLKSKFVNRGASMWKAGGTEREAFIRDALTARVKMTTEAVNVRGYIDAKFEQTANPAIFVMGDLNDGPGKEFFERQYLFFDLISNIQGDIFAARRFLNHALFDFPEHLRWTVRFRDFVEPDRNPHILLDHILFTQGLVDGSLPWTVNAGNGMVEHELHELVNAGLPQSATTSDHRPVSLLVDVA